MLALTVGDTPSLPGAPASPFRFLKSKAKVLSDAVPPAETVTLGVPVPELTVAVTSVIVTLEPELPLVPFLTLKVEEVPSVLVTVIIFSPPSSVDVFV